jgi:hypothetical protein
MKRLLIVLMLFGTTAYAQNAISPTLVPEGALAFRLAQVLNVGMPYNEEGAEDLLLAAGIAPSNGWISEYPVTPSLLAELQEAISVAADNAMISLPKPDALNVFWSVVNEFGLSVTINQPPQQAPLPPQPDEGAMQTIYATDPPIYTYYDPPIMYLALYAWMPGFVWYGGYFWPGYWMLRDFHRGYYWRGQHRFISNHVMRGGVVVVIDPIARHSGGWRRPGTVERHPIMPPREPNREPERHPVMPPREPHPAMPHNPVHIGGGHRR